MTSHEISEGVQLFQHAKELLCWWVKATAYFIRERARKQIHERELKGKSYLKDVAVIHNQTPELGTHIE